jgi:hypothetical protein
VRLGILILIKDEGMTFLGEEKGEFMALIPLGCPRTEHAGPRERALDYAVKKL